MRVIVPSLSNAILAFQQNRRDWFYDDFPRHFDSLGGRFSNFVFCDGQHRTAFDLSYLDEVLRKAGFREVIESAEGQSRLYGETVPAFEPGDALGLPHWCMWRRSNSVKLCDFASASLPLHSKSR